MKVLLYNWVSYDDEKTRGGGVTVYLKNLIKYLQNNKKDIDITFLHSGSYYDIYDRTLRYELVDNCIECKNYAIVNSPVFAPAYLSFPQVDTVLEDVELKDVFIKFLEENGPFDVVHFHNLEGLSLKVLEIKSLFPKIKFIYTLHNYYAFCPQVNLWRKESICCKKNNTDEECIECMRWHVPFEKLRYKMAMTYTLCKRNDEKLRNAYKECGRKLDEYFREEEFGQLKDSDKIQRSFIRYRREFVDIINKNIDIVLGVSQRVCDIANEMGIEKQKIRVAYIGTQIAEQTKKPSDIKMNDEVIELIYLGYRRKDKGYFFLLDVLETLPDFVAKRIAVTIAAKTLPDYPDREINKSRFKRFEVYDGYERESLEELLKGKHLGIVPVLWEDNLPQVAIEMVALGVPIITSNRGGASELGNNELFQFEAENVEECCEKIKFFVENPEKLQDFWRNSMELVTMDKHLEELLKIYNEEKG